MAIYHHVADKEQILDEMVEAVFREIDLPSAPATWREAMEQRCRATRSVLARHTWAIVLLDSRTHPGPATLGHHDWVIAQLRNAGFSLELTAHAFAVLDSFLYGFAQQEAALPFPSDAPPPRDLVEGMLAGPAADALPHLSEMAHRYTLDPGYAFGDEFEWGLALVLDGLEIARSREAEAVADR
jgi:AcrR family transcriptional regulator